MVDRRLRPGAAPGVTPRTLLVTNDYPPDRGGIQRYLLDLVKAYPGEMLVAAPAGPATSGVFRGPAKFMWPTVGTRRWLESVIRETEPEVVLFGAPHPLAFLGPRLELPYAVLAHGAEVSVGRAIPGYGAMMVRALRSAGAVLSVSEHTAHAVRGAAGVGAVVVGAGVDLHRLAPQPAPELHVLTCVSRFVPRKGHLRVLEAGERLHAEGLDLRVVLAGDGRMAGRIEARASRARVPVDVVVRPTDVQVAEILRRTSVFCMPARSRWIGLEREGLGLVYLEAAAVARPVLAGLSGGAPETIEPGVTGFTVESVDDIVAAVRLLVDREVRTRFGEAGRRRVEERYNWADVAARFGDVLASIT